MSKLTLLVAAVALVNGAHAHAQSAAAETERAQLVADCNGMADSPKRRNIRACETLASEERLSLVAPAAAAAYRQYREERFQACLRRQNSPRGASREQGECEP